MYIYMERADKESYKYLCFSAKRIIKCEFAYLFENPVYLQIQFTYIYYPLFIQVGSKEKV